MVPAAGQAPIPREIQLSVSLGMVPPRMDAGIGWDHPSLKIKFS
jgi:hypothetical protein